MTTISSKDRGEWAEKRNIDQLTNAVMRRIPQCSFEDLKNFFLHSNKYYLDYTRDNIDNLTTRFKSYQLRKQANPSAAPVRNLFGFFGSPEFFGHNDDHDNDCKKEMIHAKLDLILKGIQDLQVQISRVHFQDSQAQVSRVHSDQQFHKPQEAFLDTTERPPTFDCFENNWNIDQLNQ